MKVNDLTEEFARRLKNGDYAIFNPEGILKTVVTVSGTTFLYDEWEDSCETFKRHNVNCEMFPIESIKKPEEILSDDNTDAMIESLISDKIIINSFKSKSYGTIYSHVNDGNYYAHGTLMEKTAKAKTFLERPDVYSIHSINRLRDNKVFTIGDRTKFGWIIDEFIFTDFGSDYHLSAVNKKDGGGHFINDI